MVRAHAPLINGGYRCEPNGILEIRTKNGDIVYQHEKRKKNKVIKEEDLAMMQKMMRSVIERGTGKAANVDENIIGKTGSNGSRDAWFFGGILPATDAVITQESDDISLEDNLANNSNDETESSASYDDSVKAIVNKGLVVGVWIGNDSANSKMAPLSTGGRIPTRMAGAMFKKFLGKDENGSGKEDKKLPIAVTIDQLFKENRIIIPSQK
jgi:membrane peptidoglycan carboxypeptidase